MINASQLVAPLSLARFLRRGPPAPTEVVRLLSHAEVELAFRDLVRRVIPGDEIVILSAGRTAGNREAERVWGFCSAFERHYFPVYECDELDHLLYCIGFLRLGWTYDAFHDLDLGRGTLLLRALCAEPYETGLGARVPLSEAIEGLGVPRQLLLRIPADGLSPAHLHTALDGGLYAAAAEFADWTWGQTDLAFLDCDDEMEVVDMEWSDENVQELSRQWQTAKALMDRVTALEAWLEQDPARHFAQLVEAALGGVSEATDSMERSAHAQEITPCESAGVEPNTILAVPSPAAA